MEAFQAFFDEHHADLSRLGFLLTGDPVRADDLAADALVEVRRRWGLGEGGAERLSADVWAIVVGLAHSRLRTPAGQRRRCSIGAVLRRVRSGRRDVHAGGDVLTALDRLPFLTRACVVLRCAFDFSEQETARTLGVSVHTVTSRTSRGIALLEDALHRTRAGRATVGSGKC
ncbi:sigma factor-like helix-turn-helix DNA-binding protein [Streptomyces alanosinicus]|uniref:RNA polymerase sigma factor n=1 Tax=Streptomyces alanosinicus TaxID=68171 RepID=A0A918YPC1_9ACTN|nr:sigma factor-like helix-turn-helix DNA-binding protein [Streptomyces alanosinicus]GHE10875.1 RNA polymerase sigma factor [Streptomyces alanosinicus]